MKVNKIIISVVLLVLLQSCWTKTPEPIGGIDPIEKPNTLITDPTVGEK